MNLLSMYLSVRASWHDNDWDEKKYCCPNENGSGMFLPRIAEVKDVSDKDRIKIFCGFSGWVFINLNNYQVGGQ